MACSSCGKARVSSNVVSRNSGTQRSAPTSTIVDSQSIVSRAQTPVASNPNSSAQRTKV
jgi:hypothetical protein